MAGSGRRTFTPGEVLTASNVMNYLQDQAVMNFAGTAARGSAIGSAVSQGMVSYLDDSNSLEVYKTVGTAVAGWEPVNLAQSPNVIINGAFDIWQRGTSFTPTNGLIVYTADRFWTYRDTTASVTVSRQTFTPGSNPDAPVENAYFFRYAQTTTGSGGTLNLIAQYIEDCRTFAGQTVTLSFWAKADAARTITPQMSRGYGSGGSAEETIFNGSPITLTTSWARYSVSISVPNVTGKTINDSSNSNIAVLFKLANNVVQTIDLWGVQLEAGSTATPFRRNANSIQGELAACQRYYYRVTTASSNSFSLTTTGTAYATNGVAAQIIPPASMRIAPSSIEYANVSLTDGANARVSATSVVLDTPSQFVVVINIITAGGLTQYRPYYAGPTTGNIGYIGLNAEL